MGGPRDDKRRRRRRNDALVVVALVVLGGACAHAFHASGREKADRAAAKKSEDESVAALKGKLDGLMRELDVRHEAVRKAMEDTARAPDEAERAAAHARLVTALADEQMTVAAIRAAAGGASMPGATGTPTRTPCTCDAGDPVCSML
ncbi:MAG: hypothetical protein JWP87_2440 [Labilithrix sp.]|nr:hypothetical protein [Labilithrix sp.]